MTGAALQVLTIVSAPYGVNLSARQFAEMIADPKSASECNAPVFAFFCEINPTLQKQFMKDMGVDEVKVSEVASQFSELSGYALPLAA
jgi:hypothetical protein